jgi:hypothetical protein
VIERALKPFKTFGLLAWPDLVHQRVELLFLPSMAVATALESLATFVVGRNESPALPVLTDLDFITEQIRSSSEVLEIMRVDALGLVVLVVKRTPFCLEEKHVKVEVVGFEAGYQMMNQSNFNVLD